MPLDDPETYALLQRGDAKGVFQFESDGIRELLKRMKPDNIRDIIASNALYRPGPLGGGMVDAYVNRKHGREKPVYPHPVMEEILGETYGVMVYQEQVMRILNRLGGIELSSAYACIKAISKKKQEIIDQRRAEFLKGAQERGVDEATAREIFDLITFFGGYGFNKSPQRRLRPARLPDRLPEGPLHARVHGRAAVQRDRGRQQARHHGRSTSTTPAGSASRCCRPTSTPAKSSSPSADGKILFGLTAIKGVGRGGGAGDRPRPPRGGPFKDLFDFCERVDLRIGPPSGHRTAHQGRRLRSLRRPACAVDGVSCPGPAGRRRAAAGPPLRPAQFPRRLCERLGGSRSGRRRRCPTSPNGRTARS